MSCKRLNLALACLLIAGCATGPSPESPDAPSARPAPQVTAEQSQKFKRALADIQSGDLEQARSTLEALVAEHDNLAAAHNNLGVIYRREGAFDKARAQYQKALQIDPDNRDAHLNLGILYDVYLQNPADALPHYQRYQALSSEPDKEVALWIADLKQRL